MTKRTGEQDIISIIPSGGGQRSIQSTKRSFRSCSQRQRRVSFATTKSVIPPTAEIAHDLWYSKSDLVAFRASARAISDRVKLAELDRIIVEQSGHIPSRKFESLMGYRAHLLEECVVELETIFEEEGPGCPRGLEFHSSFVRPRGRSEVIRTVLEAQEWLRKYRPGPILEKFVSFDMSFPLANVSSKATMKARDVALETARGDFVAAYGGSASHPSNISEPSDVRPSPPKRRRKNTTAWGRREELLLCRKDVVSHQGEPLIFSSA